MRVLSLFSGAGGLDLGLRQAGLEVVWANDIDRDAAATYRRNLGAVIHLGDIRTQDLSALPGCDVVVGGFPCQGFSLANLRRHADDERNTLYRAFRDVVAQCHPPFFVAENVRGLLSLDHGAALRQIVADFEALGYQVSVNLVNMADYGVPQCRRRVIIVGEQSRLSPISPHLVLPSPTHSRDGARGERWVTMRQALEHFPPPGPECGIPNHIGSSYHIAPRNFTGHRSTLPDQPSPTILARGNGGGGVVAIPHYNGQRRLTIRESAAIQTFPDSFVFEGGMNSCYRQIGNAVPPLFARRLGEQLLTLEPLCV